MSCRYSRGFWGVSILLAGLIALAAVSLIRDPLDIDERPYLERELKLAANSVQADIKSDMEARILAQIRFAQIATMDRVSPDDWSKAATLFLAHHPGYLGVCLAYSDGRVEKSLFSDRADKARFVNTDVRHLLSALETTASMPALAASILLPGERPGYLLAVRGEQNGNPKYLVAMFDAEATLASILGDHVELGYSIAVRRDKSILYESANGNMQYRPGWQQISRPNLPLFDWTVVVWPKSEMVEQVRSSWPEIVAIFTMILLLLLGSTLHFARKAHVKTKHLELAHAKLEERVQERTAQLNEANTVLNREIRERVQIEDKLRNLTADLLAFQDAERRRIARELHDSTAQTLSGLKIDLTRCAIDLGPDSPQKKILVRCADAAEHALCEIRTMSYLLHPPILEDFGLPAAVKWYVQGFTERSGIVTSLNIDKRLSRLAPDVELAMFRVVQEALVNVHRHSGSQTANVSIVQSANRVRLTVMDEGYGLPPELLEATPGSAPRVGVGIAGMIERVRQLEGTLVMQSNEHGTTIEVVLPLEAAKEKRELQERAASA